MGRRTAQGIRGPAQFERLWRIGGVGQGQFELEDGKRRDIQVVQAQGRPDGITQVAAEGRVTRQCGMHEGKSAAHVTLRIARERIRRPTHRHTVPSRRAVTVFRHPIRVRHLPERQAQSPEIRQPRAKFAAVMKHTAENVTVGRDIGRDGEVGNGKAVERSRGLGTDKTDAGDSPRSQRHNKTEKAILGH